MSFSRPKFVQNTLEIRKLDDRQTKINDQAEVVKSSRSVKKSTNKRKFELEKNKENSPPKGKKRKINPDARAFNPKRQPTKSRQNSTKNHTNILALRALTDKNIVGIDGKTELLKTAAIFNIDRVTTNLSPDEIHQSLMTAVGEIPTHRPIDAIVSTTKNGSPKEVTTPNKTKLKRVARFSIFDVFSNHPASIGVDSIEIKNKLPNPNDFFQTEVYKSIKKALILEKKVEITVTEAMYKKTKRDFHANGKNRSESQNKIMVKSGFSAKDGSATEYVNKTILFKNIRWEWVHLVAYMILGKESQHVDNLVAGSDHANTEMMFAEAELKYLSKLYPEGVTLEISANLIKNTHIATHIQYTIKTKDFSIPIVFNAQTPNKPHICYQQYFHALVKSLAKTILMKAKIISPTTTTSKNLLTLFNSTNIQTTVTPHLDKHDQSHNKQIP